MNMTKNQKFTVPLSQHSLHNDIAMLQMRIEYHTAQMNHWNDFFQSTKSVSVAFEHNDYTRIIDIPNISAATIPEITAAFNDFTQRCHAYHKNQQIQLQARLDELQLLVNVQGIPGNDGSSHSLETNAG